MIERVIRLLLEKANIPLCVTSQTGRVLLANSAMCEITGLCQDEALTMDFTALAVDANAYPGLLEQVNEHGEIRDVFWELKGSSGKRVGTRLSIASLEFRRNRAFLNIVIPVSDRENAGAVKSFSQCQLQHTQRLESLGVLTGGIAHDFNNLLVGILGNVGIALLKLSPDDPVRDNILLVEKAARRATDLATQMLIYAGEGCRVIETIDLEKLIQGIVDLIEVSLFHQSTIQYDFAGDIPLVEADPTELRQVVMNLVINASEAIGNQPGLITVRTGWKTCDSVTFEDNFASGNPPPGKYAFVEVADTGCGMEKELQRSIFDPFMTSKQTGRGLGLSTVRSIVHKHKGAIKVDSAKGEGTTFTVLLPAATLPGRRSEQPTFPSAQSCLKGKRVLFVDDEAAVRAVSKQLLETLGLSVVAVESGPEALGIFEKNPSRFDCIILDMKMPQLAGNEILPRLRAIREDVSVLLSSGFLGSDVSVAGDNIGFIQKPYTVQELQSALLRLFSVLP